MSSDNEDKTMFAMRINKSEKNELRKLYADWDLISQLRSIYSSNRAY